MARSKYDEARTAAFASQAACRHVVAPRGGSALDGVVLAARGARLAAALAQFDPHVPTSPQNLPISVTDLDALLRHGYLAPTAGGYVRTAKPFVVEP